MLACAARVVKDPRVYVQSRDARDLQTDSHALGTVETSGNPDHGGATQAASKSTTRTSGMTLEAKRQARQAAGAQFWTRAFGLLVNRMTESSIAHVQNTALLAYFLATSGHPTRAWILAGQALRMCQDLNLHRRVPIYPHSHMNGLYSATEEREREHEVKTQLQSRIFWSVYNLERTLGIYLGRPGTIQDEDIDVYLPASLVGLSAAGDGARLANEGAE